MNKLTIKLSGPPGSGKSTIASAITDFLREKGFDVSFHDEGDPPSNQEYAFISLKMFTEINVVTEQSYRTVKIGRNESGLLDIIPFDDKDKK